MKNNIFKECVYLYVKDMFKVQHFGGLGVKNETKIYLAFLFLF